ncbi:MAG: SDR family oxidoreductase [Marmoricola sp.]
MKVAVAGGTGMVGTKVVEVLKARGDDVVVLARAAGVDLVSGSGLAEALEGVEVVVDVTSLVSRKASECIAFFGAVARNLQEAGAAAGVRRIVTLSIVGIDGLGGSVFGHYDGKRAQEAATEAGTVPTVILRATQFHDFPRQLIEWTASGPFMPCPKQPVQSVELDAVVRHLVRLVDEPVDGDHVRVEVAGPEKALMADLVRKTAKAQGKRLIVVPVWLPGETARKVRAGVLQASPTSIIDGRTFDEWLATSEAR